MEGKLWLAITLAIVASANLNVGKAIQKWKVKVLGDRRQLLAPGHRKDFVVWICGVLLTMSATILYSLALKYSPKPSLVSSMNGVGMIGLVLFAWLVLKERLGIQEFAGAALVLIGATVMGLFEVPPRLGQHINLEGMIFIEAILLAIAGPAAYWSWRTHKLHGLAFGTLVGILLGTAVIFGKLALVAAGNDFIGQLKTPYPYVALFVGLIALILTQLAFWRSTAMVVVPTMNSVMILSPALFQYFVLNQTMQPLQYLASALIVGGVVCLTATEKADKLEGREAKTDEHK
jgi:drug/metabolite transporter (DMT)-like permease